MRQRGSASGPGSERVRAGELSHFVSLGAAFHGADARTDGFWVGAWPRFVSIVPTARRLKHGAGRAAPSEWPSRLGVG
jgi:hypothetical protein